jgi:hypothetical protein
MNLKKCFFTDPPSPKILDPPLFTLMYRISIEYRLNHVQKSDLRTINVNFIECILTQTNKY